MGPRAGRNGDTPGGTDDENGAVMQRCAVLDDIVVVMRERTARRPRTVTADRGYGEACVDNDLHELGVRTVVIPRKADPARPGKARQGHEHRRAFRRTGQVVHR
jgi:IS5 family transposase